MRRLSVVVVVSLAVLSFAVWLSVQVPYLGLSVDPADRNDAVLVTGARGPATAVPIGFELAEIANQSSDRLPITADILIEEPDTLPTRAQMLDVMSRSGAIFDLLGDGPVTLVGTLPDGQMGAFEIQVASARPVADLPMAFWIQVGAGILAALVGAWVWSLNPTAAATIAVLVSGLGLQLSATIAAVCC